MPRGNPSPKPATVAAAPASLSSRFTRLLQAKFAVNNATSDSGRANRPPRSQLTGSTFSTAPSFSSVSR
jgi:hypothetical protein